MYQVVATNAAPVVEVSTNTDYVDDTVDHDEAYDIISQLLLKLFKNRQVSSS